MILVEGVIQDAAGDPIGVEMRWQPLTGPTLAADGNVVSKSIVRAESDATTGAFSVQLEPGDWRVTWAVGSQVSTVMLRVPEMEGTYTLEALNQAYNDRAKTQVLAWAMAGQFALANQEGILTSSSVTWPDGRRGTYTCTQVNTLFGVPDAFTVTYVSGPVTYTVTQSPVTRNDSGDITNAPSPSIS